MPVASVKGNASDGNTAEDTPELRNDSNVVNEKEGRGVCFVCICSARPTLCTAQNGPPRTRYKAVLWDTRSAVCYADEDKLQTVHI